MIKQHILLPYLSEIYKKYCSLIKYFLGNFFWKILHHRVRKTNYWKWRRKSFRVTILKTRTFGTVNISGRSVKSLSKKQISSSYKQGFNHHGIRTITVWGPNTPYMQIFTYLHFFPIYILLWLLNLLKNSGKKLEIPNLH